MSIRSVGDPYSVLAPFNRLEGFEVIPWLSNMTRTESMSNETYWLNKRDAEFVVSAVTQYGKLTKEDVEGNADSQREDPVYEIPVTRHEPQAFPRRDRKPCYITLRSALLAEVQTPMGRDNASKGTSNEPT